jgi:hypothetical protein
VPYLQLVYLLWRAGLVGNQTQPELSAAAAAGLHFVITMAYIRLSTAAVLCGLLLTSAGFAPADNLDDAEHAAPQTQKCFKVRSEARYGAYGYDHLVEIENTCDKTLLCTVKTDVNPEPSQLTIPGKEKRTVVTFRGSPAREFKPDVRCTPQG